MEFLDATILTTALPKMAQSLQVRPIDLSVGVSIYALTLAVFILPSAWVVERIGARAAARLALDGPGLAAAGLAALAVLTGWLLARHIRRTAHPIVEFAVFRIPSFRLRLPGGSAARMFISAVPFVLPLMFQLGMGFDATRAGLMVTPLFVGNIGIKPFTTAILRRFGFR